MGALMAQVAGPLTALWAAVPPGDSDPASGKGPEWGKAAPIGLLVWLLLGLALFLLIKSLNRNLRKVPASFDTDESVAGQQSPGGAADPPGGSGEARGTVTVSGDGPPDGAGPPEGAVTEGTVTDGPVTERSGTP